MLAYHFLMSRRFHPSQQVHAQLLALRPLVSQPAASEQLDFFVHPAEPDAERIRDSLQAIALLVPHAKHAELWHELDRILPEIEKLEG